MLSKRWVFILIIGLSLTSLVIASSYFFPSLRFAPTQPQDSLPQSITVYAYGPSGLLSKQHGGEISYYHTDSLGSSSLVTNTDGNRVYYSDYEPFGSSLHASGEERYTYTGKEQDDSTGLYYYGARYYDSALGRFISSDPISGNVYNSQRLNKYTYVMNNPMVYTDPSGMEGEDVTTNKNQPLISDRLHFLFLATPNFILDYVTGGYGRGARFFIHYLHGSGTPMDPQLSSEEWRVIIGGTDGRNWAPSSFLEYPANEGWEYIEDVEGESSFNLYVYSDTWNMLGRTTLVRKKFEEAYRYEIAREYFDFVGGAVKSEYARLVPKLTADIAEYLFPQWVSATSDGRSTLVEYQKYEEEPFQYRMALSEELFAENLGVGGGWLQEHGKPFPVVDSYEEPIP